MTLTVAVSGLHRGENPQPGAPVAMSLRRRFPDLKVIGLVYDAWESGIYASQIADFVYQMPFPQAGSEALWERLDYILNRHQVDLIIPCLDAELHGYIKLQDDLHKRGTKTLLPSAEAFKSCRKSELSQLADSQMIKVPRTFSVVDVDGLRRAAVEIGYPVFVKGPFYGAFLVYTEAALIDRFHELIANWGGPVVVQQLVVGGEFDVVAVADGQGNTGGYCAIRKTIISDRGKGFGGVTIEDDRLREISLAIIDQLHWSGPLELEFIKSEAVDAYYLIEINPRFPAWIDFPSAFGHNLPALLVDILTRAKMPQLPSCPSGKFFVRYSVDLMADVADLGSLSTSGELQLTT